MCVCACVCVCVCMCAGVDAAYLCGWVGGWVCVGACVDAAYLCVLACVWYRCVERDPVSYLSRLLLNVVCRSVRLVMAYVLYWSLVAVVYGLMFFINDVDPPKYLNYVLAGLVGSRGVVTLLAWLATRSLAEVGVDGRLLGGKLVRSF